MATVDTAVDTDTDTDMAVDTAVTAEGKSLESPFLCQGNGAVLDTRYSPILLFFLP